MAAAPVRARADYDHLIKVLLIGDSGKFFSPQKPPPLSPYLQTKSNFFSLNLVAELVFEFFCVLGLKKG